jgi:hypothetical protein
MTTSDETRIERDLIELARPSPRDDAFARSLRGELAERTVGGRSERKRARPLLRWRLLAIGTAVALAAAAAAMVLGTRGTGGPETAAAGVLAHARQALTPPANRIVHVKLVGAGVFHESWQLTSPPHSARWIGTLGGGPEISDDGTNEYLYDGPANTIYSRPSVAPLHLTGPLSQIRADLASGAAHVAGTATIDGRQLHVVRLPHGFVAYIDPSTYRPRFVDYPTGRGVVRLRVAALEYLPKTAATLPLLSLQAQHPEARVKLDPSAWNGK